MSGRTCFQAAGSQVWQVAALLDGVTRDCLHRLRKPDQAAPSRATRTRARWPLTREAIGGCGWTVLTSRLSPGCGGLKNGPRRLGLAPHEPVNITLRGKRLFANAIKLRILRQRLPRIMPALNASQVSSEEKYRGTCDPHRRGGRGHLTTEADFGLMWPPAKERRWLPGAGGGEGPSLLESSWGAALLLTPRLPEL